MVTLAGWEKPGARALSLGAIGDDEQAPQGHVIKAMGTRAPHTMAGVGRGKGWAVSEREVNRPGQVGWLLHWVSW